MWQQSWSWGIAVFAIIMCGCHKIPTRHTWTCLMDMHDTGRRASAHRLGGAVIGFGKLRNHPGTDTTHVVVVHKQSIIICVWMPGLWPSTLSATNYIVPWSDIHPPPIWHLSAAQRNGRKIVFKYYLVQVWLLFSLPIRELKTLLSSIFRLEEKKKLKSP